MRTFLLAGHDTTSGTLQWCFYHLSKHPDVENKMIEEYSTVLDGRDPEYDVSTNYHIII
jgi:cytochrome P450